MTKLTKEDTLAKLELPPTVYAIWDIKGERFHNPPLTPRNTICTGLWKTEEDAIEDCQVKDYEIIIVALEDKIPNDLIRLVEIFDNDPGGLPAKKHAIYSKLFQLMRIFVLGNEALKEQLRKKYRE